MVILASFWGLLQPEPEPSGGDIASHGQGPHIGPSDTQTQGTDGDYYYWAYYGILMLLVVTATLRLACSAPNGGIFVRC